jgi:hypothetical protein
MGAILWSTRTAVNFQCIVKLLDFGLAKAVGDATASGQDALRNVNASNSATLMSVWRRVI